MWSGVDLRQEEQEVPRVCSPFLPNVDLYFGQGSERSSSASACRLALLP